MSLRAMQWAMEQKTGSAVAKLVLVKLAFHADDDGIAFPSIRSMAEHTELGPSTVYKYLNELEAQKLLKRCPHRKRMPSGTWGTIKKAYQLAIPSHGSASLRGRESAPSTRHKIPPRRIPYAEPSSEPLIELATFVAPSLNGHVERLSARIGADNFRAFLGAASFLDEQPPRIVVNSACVASLAERKFGIMIRREFGEDTVIVVAGEAPTGSTEKL